jgi:crooked neck
MLFIVAYVKFEFQKGDISRIRDIYRRFVVSEQTTDSWIKWAKFEEKQGEIVKSRQVFESAIEYLGESANDESFFISFAKFEERCKEFERARTIYKYALDHIPKHQVSHI